MADGLQLQEAGYANDIVFWVGGIVSPYFFSVLLLCPWPWTIFLFWILRHSLSLVILNHCAELPQNRSRSSYHVYGLSSLFHPFSFITPSILGFDYFCIFSFYTIVIIHATSTCRTKTTNKIRNTVSQVFFFTMIFIDNYLLAPTLLGPLAPAAKK